jgi:hypothetical protein
MVILQSVSSRFDHDKVSLLQTYKYRYVPLTEFLLRSKAGVGEWLESYPDLFPPLRSVLSPPSLSSPCPAQNILSLPPMAAFTISAGTTYEPPVDAHELIPFRWAVTIILSSLPMYLSCPRTRLSPTILPNLRIEFFCPA